MELNKNEFAPYYATYISKSIFFKDIVKSLKEQEEELDAFFSNIPVEKHEFRYEVGKWTIKDILLHLIDAERVFSYRALRISRNDKTEMPDFEENDYVLNASANNRTIENLLLEYKSVRSATISLFTSFTEEQKMRIGTASNSTVSVRALGYIILGHELHHVSVIKERYL